MHRSLPPLNALRAFETAARHGSLTKAAAELNVTPGALSHQIRGLEEHLAVKLFDRKVRAMALTSEGRLLLPGLQHGFDHIRQAVERLRSRNRSPVIVIAAGPGFTAKCLAPRLFHFAAAHPEIDLRISASMSLANLRTDGVDIALRALPRDAPPDPDVRAMKLVDIVMLPVCSPRLIDPARPLRCARDILRLPLLHDDTNSTLPGWSDWLAEAGVAHAGAIRGLRFSSSDHSLDAALEGAGVLLANKVLALDELRTGRLVVPFDLPLETRRAYYVVSLRERFDQPSVTAFRAWITSEMAAMLQLSATDGHKAGGRGKLAARKPPQRRPRRRAER